VASLGVKAQRARTKARRKTSFEAIGVRPPLAWRETDERDATSFDAFARLEENSVALSATSTTDALANCLKEAHRCV
jgi:hypothetical protein